MEISACVVCDGSSDRSFIVKPLRYFSFQPVLHDWCNKGCGMCYPVCVMMHITDPLLLIEKTGLYSAMAMSSTNRLVGTGFTSRLQPRSGF